MKTELWISHSHLHSHSQSQTCAIRYDSVRVSSRLEIYVAQKLRFDGRGSSCECRGQRQGQRLLVVRRLGVAWGATGGATPVAATPEAAPAVAPLLRPGVALQAVP